MEDTDDTEEELVEAVNDWFEIVLDEAIYGREEETDD